MDESSACDLLENSADSCPEKNQQATRSNVQKIPRYMQVDPNIIFYVQPCKQKMGGGEHNKRHVTVDASEWKKKGRKRDEHKKCKKRT